MTTQGGAGLQAAWHRSEDHTAMGQHTLSYSLQLDLPRETVFAFFAEAGNLERTTPPELRFTILTSLPIDMRLGTLIDYRLNLFGIPFRWKTRITVWSPPDEFVDEQVKGPYAQWAHRHTFRDGPPGATVIHDMVRFSLPLSPLGEIAYPAVLLQLRRIFGYRKEAVRSILMKDREGERG